MGASGAASNARRNPSVQWGRNTKRGKKERERKKAAVNGGEDKLKLGLISGKGRNTKVVLL